MILVLIGNTAFKVQWNLEEKAYTVSNYFGTHTTPRLVHKSILVKESVNVY